MAEEAMAGDATASKVGSRGRALRGAADALTWSRVALAACLAAVAWWRGAAAGMAASLVLLIAVATDAADGPLARRAGIASARGARLDSAADAALTCAAAIAIWRCVPHPGATSRWVWVALATSALARSGALAAWRRRHGVWLVAHTWGNKASGVAASGAVAYALGWGVVDGWPTLVACAVAVASAADEFALAVLAPAPAPDARGSWIHARAGRRVGS